MRVFKSKMRRVEHVAHTIEIKNAYKVLIRKPQGKRPLGRPRTTE
jgi:hypothetical protein